jgi:hypothetical protein
LRDEILNLELAGLAEMEKGDAQSGSPSCATAADGPPRPATDAEWQRSQRREPGRTQRRLHRMPPWNEYTTNTELDSEFVFLRLRLPRSLGESFLSAVESERRHLEQTAEQEAQKSDEIGADASGLKDHSRLETETASRRLARLFAMRWRRVPTWVGLLALLEDYARTWDDPANFEKREWDQTYFRDGFRCQAPGCTSRANIEDHHLVYRSRQGGGALWNQLALCAFHHRQGEHGAFAHCRGKAPLDVVWRLGTKDVGVWYRNEVKLQAA